MPQSVKRISEVVKYLLVTNKATRDDDMYLYLKVAERLKGKAVNDIRFEDIMINYKKFNLPTFETVRRTRAKLQSQYEELAPCAEVAEYRRKRVGEFRKYAQSM